MAVSSPSLTIEKKPFLAALKSLRIGINARQKDEATLGFENGELVIEIAGNRVVVPAEGEWPGAVRIVARTLIPIVTFPPDPDPLTLCFKTGRFFIAGWSVNATWLDDAGANPVKIPSVATYLDVLALKEHSHRKSDSSARDQQEVKNARQSMNILLDQAAKLLVPVGITRPDLERLAGQKLAELRAKARRRPGD